jgi:hypothetical protein
MIVRNTQLNLLGLLLMSGYSVAYANSGSPCLELQVNIVNSTASVAQLMVEPELALSHGLFTQRASRAIKPGETQIWVAEQNNLAGPTGVMNYTWTDKNNRTKNCEIHLDQTWCGLFRAGENYSSAVGSCSFANKPDRPSGNFGTNMPGETTVTFTDE